jgi:hypothetical protein
MKCGQNGGRRHLISLLQIRLLKLLLQLKFYLSFNHLNNRVGLPVVWNAPSGDRFSIFIVFNERFQTTFWVV